MTASEVRVVWVMAPSEELGAKLASRLVQERLAACVNIIPRVRSIYRFDGAVHDDAEVMLIIKTTVSRWPELCARVVELHPYDVPEVLRLVVDEGADPYLNWVCAETAPLGKI